MRLKLLVSVFMTLLFAMLAMGALAPAQTQAAPAAWNPSWHSATVDNGNDDTGSHSSLAFNPVDHKPYVSYFRASGYLNLAYYLDGSGLTCNEGWNCYGLDGDGTSQTGAESTLTFDADGTAWIGYTDPCYALLKLVKLDINFNKTISLLRGNQGPCNNPPGSDHLSFPSVALMNGGPTVAAYEEFDAGLGPYTIARLNGQNNWYSDVEEINADVTLGYYMSQGWNAQTSQPVVAYRGNGNAILPKLHTLNYATISGAPGGCDYVDSRTGWDCRVIDFGAETGNFISFHAPVNVSDAMQVAYYDATNHQLKYARKVGGNVSCGNHPLADAGWQCDAIETIDINGFGVGVSMAVDSNYNPVIAYYNQTDYANGVLKVARYVGSGGNCGIGAAFGSWQCVVADRGLIPLVGVHSVGQNPSIALSPDGRVYISHYDATAKQLRVTNERGAMPTFTKSYAKDPVNQGDVVQATYTIQNNLNNLYTPMTRVNFTDLVTPTASIQSITSNTCGSVESFHGTGGLSLVNGVVPAQGSCTIKVNMLAQTPGQRLDQTWTLYSVEAANNPGAYSSIFINALHKLFLPVVRR